MRWGHFKFYFPSLNFPFICRQEPLSPEGGRGEQLGGLGVVGHIAHCSHGIPVQCVRYTVYSVYSVQCTVYSVQLPDVVVDYGVHGHSDAVLGQDLLGRHVERDRPVDYMISYR